MNQSVNYNSFYYPVNHSQYINNIMSTILLWVFIVGGCLLHIHMVDDKMYKLNSKLGYRIDQLEKKIMSISSDLFERSSPPPSDDWIP